MNETPLDKFDKEVFIEPKNLGDIADLLEEAVIELKHLQDVLSRLLKENFNK